SLCELPVGQVVECQRAHQLSVEWIAQKRLLLRAPIVTAIVTCAQSTQELDVRLDIEPVGGVVCGGECTLIGGGRSVPIPVVVPLDAAGEKMRSGKVRIYVERLLPSRCGFLFRGGGSHLGVIARIEVGEAELCPCVCVARIQLDCVSERVDGALDIA